MKPLIVINFKTYFQASGQNALNIAKACEQVSRETGADIRICVEAADIQTLAAAVDIPVYAQHIDAIEPGSHTGWILAENVAEAGAEGTLLNHSEHRLNIDVLERSIQRARDAGLKVIACANDAKVGEAIKAFNPDYIAVEPPELIGGEVSVSDARPELISEAVEKIGDNVLVGAGVKDAEDVRKSLELGAKGVLVASGVAKADDPYEAIRELVQGTFT